MSNRLIACFGLVSLTIACGDKDEPIDTADVVFDEDGDGVPAEDDCDDNDPNNFPGNAESCDGADNDCDGVEDNGVTVTAWVDADGDSFGNVNYPQEVCSIDAGYADNSDDCDDGDADNYPGNIEVCDGSDNDCDTLVDSDDDDVDLGTAPTWYGDSDDDGYGDPADTTVQCDQPDGFVDNADDCDPEDSAQHPGADEYCNGEDDDCNGTDDDDYAVDALTFYEDGDSDDYGDPDSTTSACSTPDGYVDNDDDCDDNDDDIHPGADEYCNGTDDDCNGTDDDDYAVDAELWYADDDGDGYGDATDPGTASCDQPSGLEDDALDCDDTDDAVNPDADEICDGVDNDCDSSTSEDAMASFTDGSGNISDVTSSVTGSSSSPASYTLSSEGELVFCDGTFYVNLDVQANVDIYGLNANASTAILDGGSSASVIAIETDAVKVEVADLTLQNGYGNTATIEVVSAGGGIYCEASSSEISLSVDDVIFSTNDADYGGGLFGYLCSVEIEGCSFDSNTAEYGGGLLAYEIDIEVEDTTFDGNDADAAGAALFSDSTVDLLEVDATDNMAVVVGALWFDGSDVSLETVEVSSNTASSVGGVYAYDSDLDWTGTSSDSSGITDNSDNSDDGAGLYLYLATASFDTVDFGTSSSGDDNSPYDIRIYDSNEAIDRYYMAGDDASFECNDSCGTATYDYVGGASSNTYSSYYPLRGSVLLASDNATIEYFLTYTRTQSSTCETNYYLLSKTSSGSGTWTVEWANTGNSSSTSWGWKGDDIGRPVESGTYYALAWNYTGCSSSTEYTYYFYGTPSTTSLDFGTHSGYLYSTSDDVLTEGDTVYGYVSTSTSFSPYQYVESTEL